MVRAVLKRADMEIIFVLAFAGVSLARPGEFFRNFMENSHRSTSTSSYHGFHNLNGNHFSGTTGPAVESGSSSGFWGLPPPPDSPYLGSLPAPDGLHDPPSRHRFGEETTTWCPPAARRTPRPEEPEPTEGWPSFGKDTPQPKEKLAKKWCNRYRGNCKGSKREVNEITIRITGGSPAPPKEHPHMVMIGYGSKSKKQWRCGGSLISDKFVLTAAHCINTTKMGQARWVRLGDLDISTSREDARPQEREVAERYVHPAYREPAVYNDIALLELDRAVTFNQWVSPVCLQTEKEIPTRIATITGWGRTDFVSDTSPALMEVNVRIFNSSACGSLIDPGAGNKMRRGFDADTMVCAGEEEGGKDACQGDSGGPLVVEGQGCSKIQVGITSVGKECGLPNSPGVYTRVYRYISWIEGIVWRDG